MESKITWCLIFISLLGGNRELSSCFIATNIELVMTNSHSVFDTVYSESEVCKFPRSVIWL